MSMNPVATTGVAGTIPSSQFDQPPENAGKLDCDASNLGTRQNRETHSHAETSNPSGPTQDAVEVQRENGNQIVIKYLDRFGGVVVQVPTSQVLSLQKAIKLALEQQEQNRNMNEPEAVRAGGRTDEH